MAMRLLLLVLLLVAAAAVAAAQLHMCGIVCQPAGTNGRRVEQHVLLVCVGHCQHHV